MVVEDFTSYFEWLGLGRIFTFDFSSPLAGAWIYLFVLGALVVLGLVFGFLVSAIRYGPQQAFYSVARVVGETFPDVIRSSPRRIWGIARLAIQESIRRRVLLVAFALFALVTLIGGLFLDTDTAHPHRLYSSSMMFFTWLLIIIMVWLLSTSSLPNDIRDKTIYTVVTKPVRPLEIVLGRIVGFGAVGTLLLVLMGVVSYFFILRHLSHSHEMDSITAVRVDDSKDPKPGAGGVVATAETTRNNHHRHTFSILSDGTTDIKRDHWHEVKVQGKGESATYELGPPEGQLQARLPRRHRTCVNVIPKNIIGNITKRALATVEVEYLLMISK
jgi:ABC-type amino acid transport system permease subunit